MLDCLAFHYGLTSSGLVFPFLLDESFFGGEGAWSVFVSASL